ncbi:MAG TPA: FKBP-type peptidyl-prolyl cis-trans isomerase N-terminal domain-containing protein [Steroidobacteraceae bacterium]|nr:FKBP-type peptidyl-prolyl cis-trans isomerase N-terminal domain-containing protein [Steroidobacteraceae bacterium]
MHRFAIALVLAAVCGASSARSADRQPGFKDRAAQESYAIGAQTARNLRKDDVAINLDMLVRGLRDGFGDGELLLSEKELRAVMSRVQQDIHRNMVLNRRAEAERNRELGTRFLAEHGKQAGVLTTASGLQYRVLKAGTGAKPLIGNVVLANYRGTLLNGTEFERSPDEQPGRLIVAQAIPGLREALLTMSAGSKWQLVLPAALAYGERGAGTDVGPNQVLQFELELVGIEPGENRP